MRVLFIGGIGRSGSTLLERVLGALPGVCALGEVKNLWPRVDRADERCGCGAPFPHCAFWTAVGEKAFGGWDRLDRAQVLAQQRALERIRNAPWLARPRLDAHRRAALATHLERYAAVYEAAGAVSGAQLIVDSSKSPGLAYCLRWAPGLDVRVLHLVRDPRGVAHSFTKHVPRPEADGADLMPRRSPVSSAVNWTTHNLAMSTLSWVGRRGSSQTRAVPVHRVRYEDFLADPRRTMRAIAAAAGLDLATDALSHVGDGHAELAHLHSAAGNPMRYAVGRVPLRRDDAWRSALSSRERTLVSAVCAPLLAAYGYGFGGSTH